MAFSNEKKKNLLLFGGISVKENAVKLFQFTVCIYISFLYFSKYKDEYKYKYKYNKKEPTKTRII